MKKQTNKNRQSLNDESFTIFKSKNGSFYCFGKTLTNIIFNDVLNLFNIILLVICIVFCLLKVYWFIPFTAIGFIISFIELIYDIRSFRRKRTIRYVNVIDDNQTRLVKESEIKVGDRISLASNTNIAVDGLLKTGSLLVDESSITGVSSPIFKKVNDPLFAGTIVLCGNGVMEAKKSTNDSYWCIIKNKFQNNKFNETKSFKAIKAVFLLSILAELVIVSLTLLANYIKGNFSDASVQAETMQSFASLSLMVTPISLMVIYLLFFLIKVKQLDKKGAKVNDFRSLDAFSSVDVVCVDKTGTITDGTLKIEKIISYDSSYDENQIHNILCQIVKGNSPCKDWFTKTLRRFFFDKDIESPKDIIKFDTTGQYTSITTSDNHKYSLGLASSFSLANYPDVMNKVIDNQLEGNFVLILTNNDNNEVKPISIFVLSENVRQNAIDILQTFLSQGIKVKILSGDDPLIVARIAKLVGIENTENFVSAKGMGLNQLKTFVDGSDVFGRCTPEQKQTIIEQLRLEKHVVAMIGDSTNDILAMKEADYSISINENDEDINNASQLVLKEANYAALGEVNKESKKNNNTLLDSLSLFLIASSFFVCFQSLHIFSILFGKDNDVLRIFEIDLIWALEAAILFMTNIFITLFKDSNVVTKRKTLISIPKGIFCGGILFFGLFAILACYLLTTYRGVPLEMDSYQKAFNSYTIFFCVIIYLSALVTLRPLSQKKTVFVLCGLLLNIISIVVINFTKLNTLFNINLTGLSVINYLTIAAVIIASFILCFVLESLMSIEKRSKKHD